MMAVIKIKLTMMMMKMMMLLIATLKSLTIDIIMIPAMMTIAQRHKWEDEYYCNCDDYDGVSNDYNGTGEGDNKHHDDNDGIYVDMGNSENNDCRDNRDESMMTMMIFFFMMLVMIRMVVSKTIHIC
jgi:hypothetical protein